MAIYKSRMVLVGRSQGEDQEQFLSLTEERLNVVYLLLFVCAEY